MKFSVQTVRFSILTRYFQYYSMDCYFRQYWRDQRLSFKGLKNNANNLVINQLRRVSKVSWSPKYLMTHEPSVWTWRCWRRSGSRTRISTTGWTPTSTPSPDPTSCSEYQKTGTSPTPSGQRCCRDRECFCFNRFTSFIICLSIYLFWRLFLA